MFPTLIITLEVMRFIYPLWINLASTPPQSMEDKLHNLHIDVVDPIDIQRMHEPTGKPGTQLLCLIENNGYVII